MLYFGKDVLKVNLLDWKLDGDVLKLYFKKVQSYTTQRDFKKSPPETTIFTDFGYVNVTLHLFDEGGIRYVLDEYKAHPKVTLFVNVEENQFIFWEEAADLGAFWVPENEIACKEYTIEHRPLSVEEWKKLYEEMTIRWDKLYHERWDSLQLEFFDWFKMVASYRLNSAFDSLKNLDKSAYEDRINSIFSNIGFDLERKVKETLNAKTAEFVKLEEKKGSSASQKKVNEEVFGIWTFFKRLISKK